MAVPKTIGLCALCALLITLFLSGPAVGQTLSPTQEQEFIDAKEALKAARSAQAEKYTAADLKKAVGFLDAAESARTSKESDRFTQASRLARAYAELAEAAAELKKEEDALTATQTELRTVKAEIERLKKDR